MTTTQAPHYLDAVAAELGDLLPGQDQAFLRAYALLVLVKGTSCTAQDVHDAWSLVRADSGNKYLIPFSDLPADVAAYDEKYLAAIREVAARTLSLRPE